MKIARVLVMVVVAAVGVIGFRWYSYVTNTQDPYQEVGITLNGYMPGPIRKWGCDRLHATFGNVLPPYNCQAGADGRSWL
jgi:hypothetical protein